jgi:hypothetical protein
MLTRVLLLILIVAHGASAATSESQGKIPFKKVFTEIPKTSWAFLSTAFSKDAIPGWAAVLGSSVVLYHYDDDLYYGAQNTGRRWGLANEDKTKTIWKVGQYNIVRLPSDTASWLYFMGDGWLDVAAVGGFFATGYFGEHEKSYNTSLQLLHGMVVSALFDQAIKRSTGRESPSDRSAPRGRWRPFPSVKAYSENTAKYDAMPSGHMMTATLMFTIIRGNYSEYDYVLMPLETTWLTVLGFAMLNNGVHWASDYPLGIAMGYLIGRASLNLGSGDHLSDTASTWSFVPTMGIDGSPLLGAVRFF